jgi:hypothetical protein
MRDATGCGRDDDTPFGQPTDATPDAPFHARILEPPIRAAAMSQAAFCAIRQDFGVALDGRVIVSGPNLTLAAAARARLRFPEAARSAFERSLDDCQS